MWRYSMKHLLYLCAVILSGCAAYQNPPIFASQIGGTLDVTLVASSASVNLGATNQIREVWNSSLNAPVFRVAPGDYFRLVLINNLTSQSTNIHWHGLQIAPIAHVDDIFAEAAPNNSYVYAFQIPATHPIGTFWYHSHAMNVSRDQVFSGMSGMFIIDHPTYLADYRTEENFLPLREILESNPIDKSLVLALSEQLDPGFELKTGTPQLWRIANVGADQRFTLNFTEAATLASLSIVALDGQMLQWPIPVTGGMTLEAGQRADLVLTAYSPGEANVTAMAETPTRDVYQTLLLSINVTGVAIAPPQAPSLPESSLVDLRTIAPSKTRFIQLSLSMDGTLYMINNQTYDMNRVDFFMLSEQVEEWTVQNLDSNLIHVCTTAALQHPIHTLLSQSFHVHQQPFQVIYNNGTLVATLAYQDVIAVMPDTSVVLRIKFPADLAGRFVFHCTFQCSYERIF